MDEGLESVCNKREVERQRDESLVNASAQMWREIPRNVAHIGVSGRVFVLKDSLSVRMADVWRFYDT